LVLTFFGLTINEAPQVRLGLFSVINQIVFHGKGGYDFNTIYNMPIWLRKFTYSEIKKFYDDEKKAHENASNGGKGAKNLINAEGTVNVPAFSEASKPYRGQTSYG
jgi:hypothetical protein